jgi:hypothetical protein
MRNTTSASTKPAMTVLRRLERIAVIVTPLGLSLDTV